MALTCSIKQAFLSTFSHHFIVHRSFKNLIYVRICLIMSSRGMLTFTCLSTSNISTWLMAFFLDFNACGKGRGVLFFIAFSFASWSSSTGLGTGCLTSLALLKVITALTSFIIGFGSLEELNSCTTLGLGCV